MQGWNVNKFQEWLMSELEGVSVSDSELIRLSIEKWELSDWEDGYRAGVTGLILENQERYFRQLKEDGQLPENMVEMFGEGWRQDVYDAIKHAWRESPLPEICSVQPFTGPIGTIAYFLQRTQPQPPAGGIPEFRLDIKLTEVRAECRKNGMHIDSETFKSDLVTRSELLKTCFEEVHTQLVREVLGTFLNAAPKSSVVESADPSDLKMNIARASNIVHRLTQRAPANHIIGNSEVVATLGLPVDGFNGSVRKVGVLDGKWTVWHDPLFPGNQVMAWYQGQSLLDTGLVYSPYQDEFLRHNAENTKFSGRSRHKITLVNPAHVALVKPKD